MQPSLVWFDRDLRLSDNPALAAAVKRGGPVVPVFIWSPEEEGDWPPGAASRWWLHQSLAALDADLRQRRSRLIIRRGPVLQRLRELIQQTGATAVFWNRRYEPSALARNAQVEAGLRSDGVAAESFNASLLFEPVEIRNKEGKPYRVFTAFYRSCLLKSVGGPRSVVAESAMRTRRSASLQSLPLAELGLEPEVDWAAGLREVWTPGERGAMAMLKRFESGKYGTFRDRPDVVGTSRLSPYLHFGEISPRQVWALATAEPYRRQLVWREFAHHLLFHFPHTAMEPLRPEFAKFPWRQDPVGLKAWQRGETGFLLVDAGMRELWRTGWMHNRVRMVVASFLVKDLLISWTEGARWFWDTLVDADLANNTLGWQWCAGCGADAAPFFRIFNPANQAAKFDPAGAYVRRWVTESVSPIVDHRGARLRALEALATIKQRQV